MDLAIIQQYQRQAPAPRQIPAIELVFDPPRPNPKMRMLKQWLCNGDDIDESHISFLREDTILVSRFGRQKLVIVNREFFYRVRRVTGEENGKMVLETVYESSVMASVIMQVWRLIRK
jgi:hypothetical protein